MTNSNEKPAGRSGADKRPEIVPGVHEATLIRVTANDGQSFANGGVFVFKLENGQTVAYYTKKTHGAGSDSGLSLKTVTYFLNCSLSQDDDSPLRCLVNRYIRSHIELSQRASRRVPIIVGFSFSTRQLFSWSGENGHGE